MEALVENILAARKVFYAREKKLAQQGITWDEDLELCALEILVSEMSQEALDMGAQPIQISCNGLP